MIFCQSNRKASNRTHLPHFHTTLYHVSLLKHWVLECCLFPGFLSSVTCLMSQPLASSSIFLRGKKKAKTRRMSVVSNQCFLFKIIRIHRELSGCNTQFHAVFVYLPKLSRVPQCCLPFCFQGYVRISGAAKAKHEPIPEAVTWGRRLCPRLCLLRARGNTGKWTHLRSCVSLCCWEAPLISPYH